MNILVTICARAGSKGVRSKNIRAFCGNPLVLYTLEVYKSFCEEIRSTVGEVHLALNTDSEKLITQVNESGVEYVLIRREDTLAGDTVSKFDVIKDTLIKTEDVCKKEYDVVIDLDLTSPLRTWKDVMGTFRTLLEDEYADIAYSVTEARRSPYFNMVCKGENNYYRTIIESNFVARQQTPVCYDMNASIYAYRREYLLRGTMHKRKALIWRMEDTGVLDIDSEKDFELLEIIFRYFISTRKEFRSQFIQLF